MRILFIASRLPHAAVTGGHTIVYQRVVRLAQRGHDVGLVSFCTDETRARGAELGQWLFDMEFVPEPKTRFALARAADFMWSPVPPWFMPYRSEAMARRVGDMVDRSRYDVVVAEFSEMGQYLFNNPYLPAVRRVISCHHSPLMLCEQAMAVLPPGAEYVREWRLRRGLRRYEFEMYRSADRLLVLTPQERFGLLDLAPNLRISVVPNGVDIDYFKPREHESTEKCILFMGHYTDEPNEDAVLWFSHAVWPSLKQRHPDLKFYVVGPEPTDALRRLAQKDPQIVVTGFVDDVRPYLERAQIFVCPVRMGAGLRVKILEAMAAGVPVVSTTIGVEGIAAQVGYNCSLADQPEIMARTIGLLLDDLPLRRSIAQRAREMVVERFAWDRSVSRLEEVLREVAGK